MTRPDPPNEPPAGYRWQVRLARHWRLAAGDRRCRYTVVPRQICGRPAAAELNRGRLTDRGTVDSWWGYCDTAGHMYAHWIEDDRVVFWALVEDDPA